MKTIRYSSFDQDIVSNSGQNHILPDDYRWIRQGKTEELKYTVVYSIFKVLAFIYTRVIRNVRIVGCELLDTVGDTGYFLYGNHTHPVGDSFIPINIVGHKRLFGIVGKANFGIPIIGRLMHYIGGIPVADGRDGLMRMEETILERSRSGAPILIYPEAHVWPYYTAIRPFTESSFRYPVKNGSPVFSMTTTYQKSFRSRRPRTTIYIDGPFYPDRSLSSGMQRKALHESVCNAMNYRCKASTYEYVRYVCEESDLSV